MDELEAQLRSWAPRRPSARLELRLFPARAPATAETSPAFRLSWLAPATAALLLLGVVVRHPNPGMSLSQSSPMFAESLSNLNAAAFLPGSFVEQQNRVPVNRYEWTLGHGSTSSVNAVLSNNSERR